MQDNLKQFQQDWDEFSKRCAFPATHSVTIFQQLLKAYSEPQRHYHSVQHIIECLKHLDEVRHLLQDAQGVELALWFHDVVYNPQSVQNEDDSALLMLQLCADLFPAKQLSKVANWIRATRLHSATDESDLQYLLDIDLAILATDEMRFNEYEAQIRKEYAWVDATLYDVKRAEVLNNFYRAEMLFQTAYFQQKCESKAKQNLAKTLILYKK